jgi:hypothetical protein
MNNIEDLLERYFEGNTSAAEEETIRRFFTSGDVPKHLAMYTPLFVFFENEIRKAETDNKSGDSHPDKEFQLTGIENMQSTDTNDTGKNGKISLSNKRKYQIRWLSGAVACAALLIGAFFMAPRPEKCPGKGDYVIIDGRCYTDKETIRSATLKTLREVSNENEEFSDGNVSEADKIIENQLKEFDFLFNE